MNRKTKEKPHYLEHRKRLRERFQRAGAEGLHGYELLELLLTYAIPRKGVKPLVKELIERFGSLSGVLDADQKALEAVPGLGAISATLIRLVKDLGAYPNERLKQKDVLSLPPPCHCRSGADHRHQPVQCSGPHRDREGRLLQLSTGGPSINQQRSDRVP